MVVSEGEEMWLDFGFVLKVIFMEFVDWFYLVCEIKINVKFNNFGFE